MLTIVFLLSACSAQGIPQAQEEDGIDADVVQAEGRLETSLHGVSEESNNSLREKNSDTDKQLGYKEQAIEWICNAFSCDVSGIEPTVETHGNLTTIRYNLEEDNFFVVEFREKFLYPSMIYHFCHLGTDLGFDLAKESSDYFKEEMITTAKNFVNQVFGVDCSEADIHAYGYGNKIAVQLELSSEEIFHVRFYYSEDDPVGVLFFNNVEAFDMAMKTNGAKQYF